MTTKRNWLRKVACAVPGLGFAGWLAWSSWGVQAQEGASNPSVMKSFLNKTTIKLPIIIEEKHRSQLQSVQLYVKEGPTLPWKLQEKVAPTQNSFTYKAPGDGEYWFNIVSVDNQGRSTPADLNKEPPGLIVVLDTKPPKVDIQPLESGAEGQYVRCDLHDEHLDTFKTSFFYQTGDQVWRQLECQAGKPDTFCVPAQAAWTGNVRVVACDLAGNSTTREMNVSAAIAAAKKAAPAPVPTATAPASLPSTDLAAVPLPTMPGKDQQNPARTTSTSDVEIPEIGGPSGVASAPPTPMPTRARVPDSADVALPPTPTVAQGTVLMEPPVPPPSRPKAAKTSNVPAPMPELIDPALAAKAPSLGTNHEVNKVSLVRESAPSQRQFVNNTRLFLDYRIDSLGASGLGKVEVWCTRDLGQSWQKLCEDASRKSPAEVNLPGEGIYGLTLVVSNGRGFGAVPPNPGDSPDYWVEVDSTKPFAELVQIRNGTGEDSAALHIVWRARDKNLSSDGVELQYAATREGPWQTIAKGLKGEGIYRWIPPVEVGPHAYIRVMVRDLAGNMANVDTPQPVPLDDLSRPRGRVLGISTAPRTAGLPVPPQ